MTTVTFVTVMAFTAARNQTNERKCGRTYVASMVMGEDSRSSLKNSEKIIFQSTLDQRARAESRPFRI